MANAKKAIAGPPPIKEEMAEFAVDIESCCNENLVTRSVAHGLLVLLREIEELTPSDSETGRMLESAKLMAKLLHSRIDKTNEVLVQMF